MRQLSMKKKINKRNTLDGVLNESWMMLERGVSHFWDPFHCPVLGTVGENGASLRTVILRKFTLPDRILVCHSDSRSTKANEIANNNEVSWLFYHAKKKVQLRITGKAQLHTDDEFADEQWKATRLTSRINYLSILPPGTQIDRPSSGLPDFFRDKVPSLFESEKGRENFMSISCRIDSMDWLILSVTGNRRARFEWEGNEMSGKWIIP